MQCVEESVSRSVRGWVCVVGGGDERTRHRKNVLYVLGLFISKKGKLLELRKASLQSARAETMLLWVLS